MSDINISSYSLKNNTASKDWYLIGYRNHYTGRFNGNRYTISGL